MRRVGLWVMACRLFPAQDPLRLWQMCGPGRHRLIVGGYDPLPNRHWNEHVSRLGLLNGGTSGGDCPQSGAPGSVARSAREQS